MALLSEGKGMVDITKVFTDGNCCGKLTTLAFYTHFQAARLSWFGFR